MSNDLSRTFDRNIENSVFRELGYFLTIDEIREMPIDEMARRAQEAHGGKFPKLTVPNVLRGKYTNDPRTLGGNPEKAYKSAMKVRW